MRLGIIGTGMISTQLMRQARRVEGVEPLLVYSREASTGEAFAASQGIPFVLTDFGELCRTELVDAVYVASPNSCHGPQCKALLAAGKHVLCEKPLAATYEEYASVRETAEKHRRVYLEAMRPLYDPALQAVKDAVSSVGTLRYARLEYCQYSSRYDRFRAGEVLNAFNPALANAAVMDIGVYAVAWAVSLFGEPKAVSARSSFLENGFEGDGTAVLEYGEGAPTVEVRYSKVTESVQPSVILGDDGAVTFGPRLNAPAEMTVSHRGRPAETVSFPDSPENMHFEVAEFARLAAAGEVFHPYADLSAAVMRTLDRIRASAGIRFLGYEP